jgi:SAM-dependent methyltransferase
MNSIKTKEYSSYGEYIAHQKSKADHGTPLYNSLLNELWESDCEGFRLNFKPYKNILKTLNKALCLGARTGQEVFVLKELGLDVIGIDLVDTPPLVLKGDVHELQFESNSYDFIFSNIFDHVLYPEKFINEIKRVLKPNGYCLLHLSISEKGHPDNDPWSSCEINSSQQVTELFGSDYIILEDQPLNQPDWPTYYTLFLQKTKSK